MNSETSIKIPIEDLFSSKGRIKIIKELAIFKELHLSDLCRRVKLSHSSTRSHLEILLQSGLIEEKIFGRTKVYRYKIEDLRARSLKSLFDIWGS
ncbi:MAG: winged helix-turn-helix domain-containing protein [Candidatus Thorarchaeota archaeon]|nr:winged helix-turn-helix domain-containing protein [Candidatus Thorarchaeota archaeon]